MNKFLAYLAARLAEPSTHAGAAALLVFLGQQYPAHKALFDAGAIVLGMIAVTKPDATSTATEAPAAPIAAEVEASAK